VIEAVQNIFNIPDLRKRIVFMLALLAVYRIGAHIPTPGIDSAALEQFFTQSAGSFLGFLDLFSGGNFRRLTVFALGIMPYITASIILQLLTVVWPYLEKLSKEGELGRRKITTYTRYLTVVLSAVQSAGIAVALQRQGQFVVNPGLGFTLMTMLTLTTGTAFIMWLGEQITERGIGNGMSLIIFAGIVVGLPRGIADIYEKVNTNEWSVLHYCPVREACRWTPRARRPIDAPSAAREYGWRHPGDLRFIDSDVPTDVRPGCTGQPLPASHYRRVALGRAAVQPALCDRHHFLLLLLYIDHFQSE